MHQKKNLMIFYLIRSNDMNQFNKKILTAGILLALGSISSAWADPALLGVTVKDSLNEKYIDKSDNSFVDKSDNSYVDKSDNSYTDKSQNIYVDKTDKTFADADRGALAANAGKDAYNTDIDAEQVATAGKDAYAIENDADRGAQAAVAGKDAYNTNIDAEQVATAGKDAYAIENDADSGAQAAVSGNDSFNLKADDGAITVFAGKDAKVNQSELDGEVSGIGYGAAELALAASVTPGGNYVADSFNGSAGILQNQQNYAYGALLQQQVSFQGNVNVDNR